MNNIKSEVVILEWNHFMRIICRDNNIKYLSFFTLDSTVCSFVIVGLMFKYQIK